MSEVRSRVGTKVGLASRGHGRPKQIGRIVKDGATLGRSASPNGCHSILPPTALSSPHDLGIALSSLLTITINSSAATGPLQRAIARCGPSNPLSHTRVAVLGAASQHLAPPIIMARRHPLMDATKFPETPRPTLSTLRPDLLYLAYLALLYC
jgi:hypothetical protein